MKSIIKKFCKLLIGSLFVGSIVSIVEGQKGKFGWVKGHSPNGIYESGIKRALDFGLSLFAIIILSPVMLFTGLLVKHNLGSPVFFKQQRPGLGGKIFTIRKFRTMKVGVGSDEERLTTFGKILRSTSLDELPELFNILQGDMSIVGPRPLLVQYLDRYSEEQAHRHEVRPGLTSLSASKDRNMATWEQKFKDDVEYANNITFLGDCKIIIDTVKIVLSRKGISSSTSSTMEEFMG